MNDKKFNIKTDAESILSKSNLKLPFNRRARNHSETNDLKFNAYNDLMNFNDLDGDNQKSDFIESLNKLASSAPNENSWFFNDHHDNTTDKSPIINSDFSASEQSDDETSLSSSKKRTDNGFKFKFNRHHNKKFDLSSSNKKSNFLQLPKPSSLFSSSTGSIDLISSNQTSKRNRKSNKNLIRKRKRCYSMDERRNLKNDSNIEMSFKNLAYNKENLSDISEPMSSSDRSEKSNEELNRNKKMIQNYQTMNNDLETNQKNKSQTPIIMINNQLDYETGRVKFDLAASGDEADKNEDKDFLIKDNYTGSSCCLDVESGSNDNNDDLSNEKLTNEIEFTTKLASELSKPEVETESLISFVFQVLFPLLLCGLGNLCSGLLLDKIQKYEVFEKINGLYIAIPCLMGLKGNLEMTMASRLSTAANTGILEHLPQILSITKSNICLLQLQATVVSLLASIYGVIIHIQNDTFSMHTILLLITSNVLTANICCTILSALMIGIILFCKHRSINPDNVATPIASSLGDVSTVFLLGYTSSFIYECIESKNLWFSPIILIVIAIITPISLIVAFKNKNTKEVLRSGWLPIIFSMMISTIAGLILEKTVKSYKSFALFQPIINGVGGNLAAIQSSRISTYLAKTTKIGHLPIKELSTVDSKVMLQANGTLLMGEHNSELNFTDTSYIQLNELDEKFTGLKDVDLNDQIDSNENKICNTNEINFENCVRLEFNNQTSMNSSCSTDNERTNSCFNYTTLRKSKILRTKRKKIKNYLQKIFSSGSIHKKCARLLILITLPMHIFYFYLLQLITDDKIFGSFPLFIVLYLMIAFTQITTLLYLAKFLVYSLWKWEYDPDTWSIPILTAFGDLSGTSLLFLVFFTFTQPSNDA